MNKTRKNEIYKIMAMYKYDERTFSLMQESLGIRWLQVFRKISIQTNKQKEAIMNTRENKILQENKCDYI